MDDAYVTSTSADAVLPANQGWLADLQLEFSRRRGRSLLARKRHSGPLLIQKTLHPEGEGICHGIIIHPPGGVAGGDQLRLTVALAEQAQVLLTTPGAGKWYKANGKQASQHLKFKLAQAASLEWLPQENILFDGSQMAFSADIDLSEHAVYVGWEILCFGRQASNERWQQGRLQQNLVIRREQRIIWQERAFMRPDSRVFSSATGLRGQPVTAGFVVVAGSVPADLLEACRQIRGDATAQYAVTALPEVFSARYIGTSAQAARHYFESIWQILRPWYANAAAVRPRIWNT